MLFFVHTIVTVIMTVLGWNICDGRHRHLGYAKHPRTHVCSHALMT